MRIVVALGGNALLRRGEPMAAENQQANIRLAAQAIAILAQEHDLIITHGNGPQVGLLALQAEAYKGVQPYPLDVLNAETEGMIGYLIEQELHNQLPDRLVVTLLTQVEVNANDPAFAHSTKPIGSIYTQAEAEQLAAERGWAIAPDGNAYRRVVPSPEPQRIIELAAIQLLVQAGALVICVGGGGIPVVVTPTGGIRGVEAVIDKDLSAALLATSLGAEALLLLTDVDAVYTHWGTTAAQSLHHVSPAQLRRYSFASGSMAPKVEAACRFVEQTGGIAGIGRMEDATAILAGQAGTRVR
ncbi:carbamate kinase [Stenomitos frigidus]|uniref:Carbamate kinase n=1 Tax=Stenomitos frigidus ULC18 TaxID=2107698 RepID=A0A2T1EQI8_9CYAN|nr:carbamate kinase [Stenomitos frigidus]PSB34928.1 carbamate kinase [Stenomitos frigidus ULC18]